MRNKLGWVTHYLYLPLLLPQLSLAFGLQVVFLYLDVNGSSLAVIWGHVIFVLPYVYLSLKDAYLSYDNNYSIHALSLGKSYWQVLLMGKWMVLLKPILTATAIGFSVSIALYLPTLYLGAGRFDTLATEVVNVASGSDLRRMANFALYQWLVAWLVFALALGLPRWLTHPRHC